MGQRHLPLQINYVLNPPTLHVCSPKWLFNLFQTHLWFPERCSRCLISVSDGRVPKRNAIRRTTTNQAAQNHIIPDTTSALTILEERASLLLQEAIAPSTRSKYHNHFKTYTAFCKVLKLPNLPASQNSLILFATYMSPNHSHKDITSHIAAIKFFSDITGHHLDIKPLHRLYRVLRGIKRTQGSQVKRPPRIPITPPILTQLGHNLWNSSLNLQDKLMLWAAMLTAFHGFLRVSEYTSSHVKKFDPLSTLCHRDIAIQPTSIALRIKASKTDPFRQGAIIHLFRNNTHLCPVQALTSYVNSRPCGAGPLFAWQDGRYLTRQGFATILARIKPQHITSMSSHSFRIGAASTAAAAGFPRWLIQALGRWTSNCYRDYIRIPHTTLQTVSVSLTKNPHNLITPFDPDNAPHAV